MRYRIELGFEVLTASPDTLDKHLDDLMDALVDEPGAIDADVTAELVTGKVAINMYVDADDDEQVISRSLLLARSAIHNAGGFTGGWTDLSDGGLPVEDTYNLRVQPSDLVDC